MAVTQEQLRNWTQNLTQSLEKTLRLKKQDIIVKYLIDKDLYLEYVFET